LLFHKKKKTTQKYIGCHTVKVSWLLVFKTGQKGKHPNRDRQVFNLFTKIASFSHSGIRFLALSMTHIQKHIQVRQNTHTAQMTSINDLKIHLKQTKEEST